MTVTLCLVLLMLGSTPSGLSEGPLGRVWPSLTTSAFYCLELYWQLHRGFPRAPSVGCDLPLPHLLSTVWNYTGNYIGGFRGPLQSGVAFPYHICFLLSGIILATASGVSEGPLGRVWPSLTTSAFYCLELYWQLYRGFPRSPSVGCGLPYSISSLTLRESAGNCFGTPNSTELNNNSTPTRSPTGSLNRMFNRHQAEITVMQFRGYSLPVHDCNGTMRPSPCPIS